MTRAAFIIGVLLAATISAQSTPAPPQFVNARFEPYNDDGLLIMMQRLNVSMHWPMHGSAQLYEESVGNQVVMGFTPQVQPVLVKGTYMRYFNFLSGGWGSIPWDPRIFTPEYSVSAWIYRFNGYWGYNLPIVSNRYQAPGECGDLNADTKGFWLGIYSNNHLRFQVHRGTYQAGTAIQGPILSANTWYHVTATRSNGWLNLYVDGVRVARSQTAYYANSPYNPMLVGSDSTCFNNPPPRFYGYIGDLGIFNRALDDDSARQMSLFRNTATGNTCQDSFAKCEAIRTRCTTLSQCSESVCVTAANACDAAYHSCMRVEYNCAAAGSVCPAN